MKLISCYIENFGGLQGFSYVFSEGLNCILEENGWGKSTLAAFLKAMFYGMERTTKRNLNENERKKYEPWNGGIYGGNLTFETDEKMYRIERFWGTRDKEDSFALYDISTGLRSEDYSENIGEELFGIDRIAFEQSIFMKQGMYTVTMTDSVATKLSGLMPGNDDMDCYEKACARIDAEMKIYKKLGNKGRIPELTEEIASIKHRLDEGKEVGASVAEWDAKKKRCEEELLQLQKEKEDLKKKMLKAGEQSGLREKQKYYSSLVEEKESLGRKLEILDQFFRNGLPSSEELEEYKKRLFICQQTKEQTYQTENHFRYPALAQMISKNPITEQELDACEEKWNEVQDKTKLLEKKELKLQTQRVREEEKCGYLKEQIKSVKKRQTLFFLLVVLFLVTAVVLYFSVSTVSACVCAVAACVCAVAAVTCFFKKRKLISALSGENTEILQMEEECGKLTEMINSMKKAVLTYLHAFAKVSDEDVVSCIGRLRLTLMEVESVRKRKEQQEKQREKDKAERSVLKDETIAFLQRFYSEVTEPDECYFTEIQQKRNEYLSLAKQYEEKCVKLARTDKVEVPADEEQLSMERLQQDEIILEKSIATEEGRLRQIIQTLSNYGEILEECEKLEMEKHDLEELLEECNARYRLLEKTLKYLKTAQTEFSSRYLTKMNQSFAGYAEMFRTGAFAHASMDVKLVVKSEENGVKREMGYYSTGFRETMELCTRLALVDALFEKEKPFVILDDPFVNLDEKSLQGAKAVLSRIAEQYQVIYFTCHPSRQ